MYLKTFEHVIIIIILKGKIILLIQISNKSIYPIYKLLKNINDEIIFKLIV